ncbi:MAG: hypothetical protein IT453_19765 [Planctomycetes bacterium]|nr:hypothetical protein [Planctomycetota bacterium]
MKMLDRNRFLPLLSKPLLALAIAMCTGATGFAQEPPSDAACRLCHEVETARNPKAEKKSPHSDVTCVQCHTALATYDPTEDEHARPVPPASCVACHADQELAFAKSAHAENSDRCANCHTPHDIGLADAKPVGCATCHGDSAKHWQQSVHAGDPGNGSPAATCVNCHGAHEAQSAKNPDSRTHPLNLPDTCESCHKPNPSAEHPAPGGAKVSQYETSAHGLALRNDGLIVTATCASCHGGHDVKKVADPTAPTSRMQIPHTCGSCHMGILKSYLAGVHGEDFEKGGKDVPVCTDCHREHAVQGPSQANSSVSPSLVADTCARCHNDSELATRYGFKQSARSSWGSSYHGIAAAFGEQGAANCASCHGFHDIFPSTDPRSSVHAANLDQTCGNCHPNAGAAFSQVPVHSVEGEKENPVPWWVKRIYAVLLGGVIGAFILLVVIDLFGRLRLRMGWGPKETEHVDPRAWPDEDRLVSPHEAFERMTFHGRIQHAILVTSFSLLVLTGLPVFLHDSEWMQRIIDLEGGFKLRSQLHRIAAYGLIGLSLWHVAAILISSRMRKWLKLMIFTPRDITDFIGEVMFNLGLTAWMARRGWFKKLFERWPWLKFDERPALGRYGLVEKLEYGAVVWGNFVMIASGAILWRPDWFLDWMPSWTFDVCRVVHGFEATLAFLAIIIWHMYHVHLRPGNFPMSWVWLNGRISRKELRHHHPEEYLRILERRRSSEHEPL